MSRKKLSYANAHPLVKQVFDIIDDQQATYLMVECRSGVGRTTLSHWKDRSMPTLGTFEAVVQALGYDIILKERP